jgi:hypothetical protein
MMGSPLRAIEVAGRVDEQRHLHLDEPLPVAGPGRVRVIILFSDSDDESAWLAAAAASPAFDFLKEDGEDIYSPTDGRPYGDPR